MLIPRRILILALWIAGLGAFSPSGATVFAGEAKTKTGPWNLEQLRKPPEVQVLEERNGVTSLMYSGEPYQGKPTRVFAYLARPEKVDGKLPAMVLVHGGGGTAFKEWAELWAKRGYIALAMDLAGQDAQRKRLPEGGPPQSEEARFGDLPVKDAWSYHAVAAVIRGVSLLSARPDVDPQRIGITGISWGGYLTCIVSGLDDRLKVSVPVYGCGFLQDNSAWISILHKMPKDRRTNWHTNFDPSTYVGNAKMPMLFVNGTNDFAYPLDSYQKTYRLVKDRNLCVTVNMPHGHSQGWAPVEIGLFVDQHLRAEKPLAKFTKVERKGKQVVASFQSSSPIVAAELHTTTDTGAWQKRTWRTVQAKLGANVATVDLPEDRPLVFFMTLTDQRKAKVSTEHEVLGTEAVGSVEKLGGKITYNESLSDPRVVSIDLDGTPTTDADLSVLSPFQELRSLYLNGTKITDAGIPSLASLPSLRTLDIRNTRVTGKTMKTLASLRNLETLYVSYTEIDDAGLREIQSIRSLEILNLRGTKITDAGMPSLSSMSQLKTLNLTSTQVTDVGLAEVSSLGQLEALYLNHTKATDAAMDGIAKLTRLQTLNLRSTLITDAGLAKVGALNSLQSLYLPGTRITNAGLRHLLGLQQLRTLNLDGTAISDAGMKWVFRLKSLQTLHLGDTLVTDEAVNALIWLRGLRWLDLRGSAVTMAGRSKLAIATPGCHVEQ